MHPNETLTCKPKKPDRKLNPLSGALFSVIAIAQIPLMRLASLICRRFFPDILISTSPIGQRKIVALTLDDAPSALSEDVLKILSDHDARATFFVIGSKARFEPGILRQIVEGGHELGNHTWCDESTFSLPPERLTRSLGDTHQLLAQVGNVRLERPGGGWPRGRVVAAARELECRCALASVYAHDTASVPALRRRVCAALCQAGRNHRSARRKAGTPTSTRDSSPRAPSAQEPWLPGHNPQRLAQSEQLAVRERPRNPAAAPAEAPSRCWSERSRWPGPDEAAEVDGVWKTSQFSLSRARSVSERRK